METTIILFSGSLFALLTFYINNKLQLGGIMASAAISVLAALFFKFSPNLLSPYLTATIPIIAMGASFVGMASSRVIRKYWVIGLAGLVFSVMFLIGSPFFDGFGGSLGSSAAIALGSVYGFKRLKATISRSLSR
ncbi:hypothetical protein MKO06_08515 [Gramella sp. GC03-9]|uniref:Uncharacterized protein n=1 Tax=Christiangramia oceanisediminis TaxID=2920386 RepID=A0A9X2I2R6_9FLAO|nr:hypothetical protein [Gramella oceanisediminis]MCP9199946.1 hypothetical protein [Gramella oceanisediminis]